MTRRTHRGEEEGAHREGDLGEDRTDRQKKPRKRSARRESKRRGRVPSASSSSSSGSGSERSDDHGHGSSGSDGCDFSHLTGVGNSNVTASFRQMDTVSSTHEYTISGFELAQRLGCGSRICSDYFEVCGQHFRLEVYPAGYAMEVHRYMSIFLTTPDASPSHVLHEVSILDQIGKGRHIVRSSKDRRTSSRPCSLSGIIAAYPRFAKIKDLESNKRRAKVDIIQSWRSLPLQQPQFQYYQHAQGGYTPNVFMTPAQSQGYPQGGAALPQYSGAVPGSQMHYTYDHIYANQTPTNKAGSSGVPPAGQQQA